MSKEVTFTANETKQLGRTGDSSVVVVIVQADADLGGGTLEIQTKPSSRSGAGETLDGGNLVAGNQQQFYVGKDMIVDAKLSGATSPDATLLFSTL